MPVILFIVLYSKSIVFRWESVLCVAKICRREVKNRRYTVVYWDFSQVTRRFLPPKTIIISNLHRPRGVHFLCLNRQCNQIWSYDFKNNYISLRNISSNWARSAWRGFPGAQASAAADSQRNGRSSSLSLSSFVGIPTSIESWRTASTAALR